MSNTSTSSTQALTPTTPSVALLGLGSMGSTLATLTLASGTRTILWNRTPSKADALIQQGATLAPDIASAVSSADIIVICVSDIASGHQLLDTPAVTAVLQGKTIIHLSTGNAKDARDAQAWAQTHGAQLLAGAIQAAPAQMGQPDTTVLISGDEPAWHQSRKLLALYGGNLVYLGTDAAAAPTMDLATLSYVYGTMIGFTHGARVAEAAGIDVAAYGRIVAQIAPSFGEFLKHEANVIASGDFTITESPMSISIDATERLATTAREAGINDEFPTLAASLFRRAGEAGYARQEAAALIKILR